MASPPQRQALVTLVLGDQYRAQWHALCEPGWRRYAERHNFDIICLEEPLDTSPRAQQRSASWQKCLILSQPFAAHYERLVWLDADILINPATAPNILDGLPVNRVGAVSSYGSPTPEHYAVANARNISLWQSRGSLAQHDPTPASYYARHGLPDAQHADVIQTGMLVLSPEHHRATLEAVYTDYEHRPSDWQYEMPPLSHELLRRESVQWLDSRFNTIWLLYALLHYPFLYHAQRPRDWRRRLGRRLDRTLGLDRLADVRRACATAAYLNSYFLHFAAAFAEARWVDQGLHDWRQAGLVI